MTPHPDDPRSLAYDAKGMVDPPALPGIRHEYVDAGGLRTHVALAGPEDAPPVLLVHGWPQHWWAWREVVPGLLDSYRVVVPDLRGHGWTEVPPSGYEKTQLTTDLLALLTALGIDRPVIWVGHDWGAWTGFLAALREPERFARMLALCIPHLWTPPHPRQLALLGYQGPISAPFIGPRIADRMVRTVLGVGRGDQPLSEADVDLFAQHIPPPVTVAMYRTFLTRELVPLARGRYAEAKLEVPTTLMVGERDLVTRGINPGSVAGQPNLDVRVLPGVAHWVPEQRPDAVVEWVKDAAASA
jgi:pimeloyl-ACP methyl ester carboxylesterase